MKNKNISIGLKRYYKKQKRNNLIQKLCGLNPIEYTSLLMIMLISLVTVLGAYSQAVEASQWEAVEVKVYQKSVEELSVEEQIRRIAKEEGFKWEDYLVRLAFCESSFNPYATNGNGGHSIDRGLFQINDYYHKEVSDECAFNIKCSTKWTMWRINSGYQHEWTCNNKIIN